MVIGLIDQMSNSNKISNFRNFSNFQIEIKIRLDKIHVTIVVDLKLKKDYHFHGKSSN